MIILSDLEIYSTKNLKQDSIYINFFRIILGVCYKSNVTFTNCKTSASRLKVKSYMVTVPTNWNYHNVTLNIQIYLYFNNEFSTIIEKTKKKSSVYLIQYRICTSFPLRIYELAPDFVKSIYIFLMVQKNFKLENVII